MPYSPWTRYLATNLRLLEIADLDIVELDDWARAPIFVPSDGGDLITGDSAANIHPFCIARREVTNGEFIEFLQSDWVPVLEPEHARQRFPLIIRFVPRDKAELPPGEHPLSWRAIHRRLDGCDPRFSAFTNDYHLFGWVNGVCAESATDHPVVWLSAYVSAVFCNWKSAMRVAAQQKDPSSDDLYYDICLDGNRRPRVIPKRESDGFRLPTAAEWSCAATGDDASDYPWDALCHSAAESEQRKGKLLREYLTKSRRDTMSVLASVANGFGIYGMIGNVREWVENGSSDGTEGHAQHGRIMGATAALGEGTFRYRFGGSSLPMVNTNLDVGFRWARSLGEDASKVALARKRKVAGKELD